MKQKQTPWHLQNSPDIVINARNVYNVHSFTRWSNEKEKMYSPLREHLQQNQFLTGRDGISNGMQC